MYDKDKVNKLQEYLNNVSVVDLLSKWGGEPKGNKYSCIYHEDRHPSLFVDISRNIFYCHSCQRGGSSAKMIHYYYEQNKGTKNYFDSLDKYLALNSEVRRELGFTSIRKDKEKVDIVSLASISAMMDDYENNLRSVELIRNKYKPKRSSRNVEEIINYCIKRQNE